MSNPPSQFSIRSIAQDDRISEMSSCCRSNLIAFTTKTNISARTRESSYSLYTHSPSSQPPSLPILSTPAASREVISSPCIAAGDDRIESCVLYCSSNGQVHSVPVAGGAIQQVTSLPVAVNCFKVFLNDRTRQWWILASIAVLPSKTPAETAAADQARDVSCSGVVYDALMVRHWDCWSPYLKRNHLFLLPLDIDPESRRLRHASASGQIPSPIAVSAHDSPAAADAAAPSYVALDIMFKWESDCPGKAAGADASSFSISPDGSKVAFACRSTLPEGGQPADMAWSTETSIFICNIPPNDSASSAVLETRALTAPAVKISGDCPATRASPVFSPCSRYVAFTAMQRPQYESDKSTIHVVDTQDFICSSSSSSSSSGSSSGGGGGNSWPITSTIDLSFSALEWASAPAFTSSLSSTSSLPVPSTTQSIIMASAPLCGSNRVFLLLLPSPPSAPSAMFCLSGDESKTQPCILHSCSSSTSSVSDPFLYFIASSFQHPNQLHRVALHSSALPSLLHPYPPPSPTPHNFPPSLCPLPSLPLGTSSSGSLQLHLSPEHPSIQPIHIAANHYHSGETILPSPQQHFIATPGASQPVHVWFLPPSGCHLPPNGGKASVALVVIVHGGPQGAIMNSWSTRWNMGWYAARGYAVVAVNFHGSTGFGQQYCDSIRGDWGGQPYRDVIAAVDWAVAAFDWVDEGRVAALGASYGGYMMNWINGHTNRFKCLVAHGAIFSLRNLYYTTEELWFPEWEFGLPFEGEAEGDKERRGGGAGGRGGRAETSDYDTFSPDVHVGNWQTPTLVIHGGKDYRVVETEAISTFTALQRRRVPSRLLHFPDEGHWVLKASNSICWHDNVEEWLKRWLQ